MSDPRFPIGPFAFDPARADSERGPRIAALEETPSALRAALRAVRRRGLDTPYRTGGWTVRQVAHHLPDSHMNGMIRMKLALTEDEPLIKTYMEDRWAELPDYEADPGVSLALLDAVHKRWVAVWRSLGPAEFGRKFRHPEWGTLTLQQHLALYAWHGRHHVGHITALREREGW
jgi:uncharacterized damage-inducible protein DinB